VVPVAEKQPGFQGAFLLTDRAGGRAMSISLWTSQEAMQAGETTGFVEAQVAKFAGLVAGSPTLEAFEVSAVTVKVQ
jgi:heme-degrading monooxygenase HmoA